jgi:hypothetical protein
MLNSSSTLDSLLRLNGRVLCAAMLHCTVLKAKMLKVGISTDITQSISNFPSLSTSEDIAEHVQKSQLTVFREKLRFIFRDNNTIMLENGDN